MSRTLRPIARPDNVRTKVYTTLRRAIIEGSLADGTALVSTELSEELRVSRTPVREAIVRLVHDGLAVETASGQVIVRPVTREELAAFFEIRTELERLAARRAAARGDTQSLEKLRASEERLEEGVSAGLGPAQQVELNEEFHATLYGASGNVLVLRAIRDLEAMTARRVILRLYERADPQTTIREHRAILSAVEAGDAEAAAREAGSHVERAGEYLLQFLELDGEGSAGEREADAQG